MHSIEIKKYQPNNKSEVIELLKANTPHYFHPSEQQDLENYLETEREDYFVAKQGNKIVGAAGINYFFPERTARMSWHIIHVDFQGLGIGTKLTMYRLNLLKKNTDIDQVVVRTAQFVYGFYETFGFQLEKIEQDFWAKNYHLYQLKLKLTSD